MEMKLITIVGCGPGAVEYVTPAAMCEIAKAQVLVGAKRLLEMFSGNPAERILVGADVQQALDQMAKHVGQRRVVVLVTGDPGLCSLAQPVIRRFGFDACRVIPGISSVQAAFACVGIDWMDARIFSAHDHVPEVDVASLAKEKKFALLAGNPATLPWVNAAVSALSATHEIYLCENLTLADESVKRIDCLPKGIATRSILIFFEKRERL